MDNRAIKIHLKCLKKYSNVFDNALFIISIDDVNNSPLIFETETELLKLGFKDIRFKIHKNNGYCESQPFYEEIVRNLKYLDGLTFFGHTKGVTNYAKSDVNIESIDAWLLGMYYLNLEFISEVEYRMTYSVSRFFGAFLMDNTKSTDVKWLYSGTFFWLNCQMIYLDEITNKIEIPSYCHQRGFAESFSGMLYEWDPKTQVLGSHGGMFLYRHDMYSDTTDLLTFLVSDDVKGYEDFKNEILENI